MANFDLKFLDASGCNSFLSVKAFNSETGKTESINDLICINGRSDENYKFCIWFDKSTAIKFAKTLRTEINKITESEVGNG